MENGIFSFYFILFYKLCNYRSTKLSVVYMFCFICSDQCIKIISYKKCCCLSSAFKKSIPNNTIPTFQEVDR